MIDSTYGEAISGDYFLHGGVINGEPLDRALLRWTQWGFVLTQAEAEGVLQPDEVEFVRNARREILYQAAMVELLAHELELRERSPCTCPLWHCAQHPSTGGGGG